MYNLATRWAKYEYLSERKNFALKLLTRLMLATKEEDGYVYPWQTLDAEDVLDENNIKVLIQGREVPFIEIVGELAEEVRKIAKVEVENELDHKCREIRAIFTKQLDIANQKASKLLLGDYDVP